MRQPTAFACRLFPIVCLCLLVASATGQNLQSLRKKGGTYAVVVGISVYQDSAITDLRYAHRDAELFAAFLQSKPGGNLSGNHLRLLTNQKASLANIQSALDWLLKKAQKGDRAIIYFSGHGDVERLSDDEKGYLLAYDTPKNNYRMNAVDLDYFNEQIVAELSRQGARVIVVTDACHSGSLAGEGIGGREATAAELMKRYATEVKMMSCQPHELSQESDKWGAGRGVFSYYLINGLKGQADQDHDQVVDLYELESYLQDRIRLETNKKQHPEVFGGRKEEALFLVDEATANELKAVEKEEIQRDFELKVLRELGDETLIRHYEQFTEALQSGQLLFPEEQSAVYYYDLMYADTGFKPYIGLLAEPLTTALLDSAQQAINAYLKTDPQELLQRDRFDQKYTRFPRYLGKAAEIFTPQDPRYRQTMAKQYYFEGLALRLSAEHRHGSDSLYRLALDKQREAVRLETRAAYIHNEMGFLLLELDQRDTGMHHLRRATELSPTWAIPYFNLAIAYFESDSLEAAKPLYQMALQHKADFASAYTGLGNVYDLQGQPDSAEAMYRSAIAIQPADKEPYYNLGVMLSALEGRQPEAESAYRQALQLDPGYAEAWLALGMLSDAMERPDSAEMYYRRTLALNPEYAEAYRQLGLLHHRLGRGDLAENMLVEAIRADPKLDQVAGQLADVLIDRERWQLTPTLPIDTLPKLFVLYVVGDRFRSSGQTDEALKAYQLAVLVNPAEPLTDYYLCVYYTSLDQEKKAIQHLEIMMEKARAANIEDDYLDLIEASPDLETLRKSSQFSEFYKRYFKKQKNK
ncbi:MAG: caspase family protein [Saprospiraceae bacterium]|nr:caspase family protein [Saprospiraceae bacterium]